MSRTTAQHNRCIKRKATITYFRSARPSLLRPSDVLLATLPSEAPGTPTQSAIFASAILPAESAAAETTSTASTDATNCWGEQYAYDIWANLASISSASSSYTGCSQETGFGYSMTTKNQISTFCYDAAGNLLLQATCPTSPPYNYTYAYDAENHLSSTNGYTYLYDGDGRRVEKQTGNPLVPYKLYYYGEDGQVWAETNGSGTVTDEYVYFDGSRIAHRDSGLLYLYANDELGSARAVIQSGSTSLTYDADFYPFGGERPVIIATDNNYKFTGKERDFESGLDDFGARFYSSTAGRFMSPDWAAKPISVPYANFGNPQSLNLYSYVQNNPTTMGDSDGHCDVGCQITIGLGVMNGIIRDGGVKPYLKNVGKGILKGTGSAVVNNAKLAAAGGNPGAIAAAVMSPGPQALQPSNTTQAQASLVTQIALPAAAGMALGPVLGAAGAGEAEAAAATTTVTHFTNDAGMAAISETGTLNAGTWVTLPSEIPSGTSSSGVESILEIGPGKGANSITFDTPSSNLTVPGNGSTTSGGATQFKLNNPQPINPANFKPTPQ